MTDECAWIYCEDEGYLFDANKAISFEVMKAVTSPGNGMTYTVPAIRVQFEGYRTEYRFESNDRVKVVMDTIWDTLPGDDISEDEYDYE